MPDCRAFLDTNSAIHYKTPDQIPWDAELGARNPEVAISMSLMEELDKKSWDGSASVKKRAKERKRWLVDRWKAKDLKLPHGLLVFTDRIRIPLTDLGLDPFRADERMIAEVIVSRQRDSTTRHILVTSDGALLILASSHGIECVELSDAMAQPIEDESEKELRQLRQENQQLRYAKPEVFIEFQTGGTLVRVDASAPPPLEEEEIVRRLESAKKENRFAIIPREEQEPIGTSVFNPFAVSGQEFAIFNDRLRNFFEEYEKYLREGRADDELSISLPINIRNKGTAPAERIRATLKFPAGIFVSEHLVAFTNEPQPPRFPTPHTDSLVNALNLNRPNLMEMINGPSDPQIERNPGQASVVRYTRLETLDQHLRFQRTLYAYFDHRSNTRPFQIEWEILTASLPKRVIGSLDVEVFRTPATSS